MYWQGSNTSVLDTVGKVPDFSRNVFWYCFLVPASLSKWALYHNMPIPALDLIFDNGFQCYSLKGGLIQNKGLDIGMTIVWNLIPQISRLLLIYMSRWVSRPESRWDMSHPIPIIDQAERLVEADPNLGPREVSPSQRISFGRLLIKIWSNYYGMPLIRNAIGLSFILYGHSTVTGAILSSVHTVIFW